MHKRPARPRLFSSEAGRPAKAPVLAYWHGQHWHGQHWHGQHRTDGVATSAGEPGQQAATAGHGQEVPLRR